MTDTPFPAPPPLRGAEIGSFAHDTVARRMPATVRRILAENTLTPAQAAAVRALADEIPHAPIRLLRDPGAPDEALWEAYTTPYLGMNWLEAPWFFAEISMYRRVLEATGYFQPGPGLRADPYALQKRLGLEHADLAQPPADMAAAISGALWGNQADLSLWPAGEGGSPGGAHLLADDSAASVALIGELAARQARVDIILDNAGAELVHDLALADVLLSSGLRLVLHAKPHPTFVSDALIADVQTTIAWLAARPGPLAAVGARLAAAVAAGRLELRADWYWTSPLMGWELPTALRTDLAGTGLLISKGDANYRRWLGDRHLPFETPLSAALSYLPTPLLLLRTCKSDVAVGLNPARMAEAAGQDQAWLTGGRWGVV
ncbi:MAG: protein-glutamate O-methyltransferase family protein, partial [Oscillochloris sp.]|nr:protein-glutamate O-methyltransferase family protein [Oscillochloris sp.]